MEYLTPLQNLLDKTAKYPDKVCLHQPVNRQWQTFTWGEVEYQARCIAAGLKAQGFETCCRIGILSKNCAQWIIADLAIMMAGMVSVPIYATAGQSTIKFVIRHSDIKAVFVGKLDSTEAAEAAISGQVLRIEFPYPTVSAKENWQQWITTFPPLADIHMPGIEDVATIVYTSGTTGLPKGVVLSYKNLASAAQCTADAIETKPGHRVLSYLPLAHVLERSLENVSLYVGWDVYFAESPDTFMSDIKYVKPLGFTSVPRLWCKFRSSILARMSQKKLNILLRIPIVGRFVAFKIRRALGFDQTVLFGAGAAPISISVLNWYLKLGIAIGEGWGMTETSGMACGNLPFDKDNLGTIGRPLDCVEMKLSDENEILIRGDAVFSEYYLEPAKTAESFVDGWFRTGDRGELTSNGTYKIIGRIKEQFKTAKGKYVVPVPLESLLAADKNIEQVCVMGSGLKQPVALVVLGDECHRNDTAVEQGLIETLQAINSQLERNQQLGYMLVCSEPWTPDNDLLTPTLKLKRNILERRFEPLLAKELEGTVLWEEDIV